MTRNRQQQPKAREGEYRKWAGDNPNFMTPALERIETVGGWVVELASGQAMAAKNRPHLSDDARLYGVTIAKKVGPGEYETTPHKHDDLSRAVGHDRESALESFQETVEKLKNRVE